MKPDTSFRQNEPNLGVTAGAADDLAWDAFRYVSDAMTALETDDFEERLFHDQEAREAVAAAVDAIGAIGMVALEDSVGQPSWATVPIPPRRPRALATLAAVATAAALLLAACWGSGVIVRRGSINATIDVALAWLHLHGDAPGGEALAPLGDPIAPEPVAATELTAIDGNLIEPADVLAERPLPSWMVAAASTTREADPDQPEDN